MEECPNLEFSWSEMRENTGQKNFLCSVTLCEMLKFCGPLELNINHFNKIHFFEK